MAQKPNGGRFRVAVHRLVMADALGRDLLRSEAVHHVNHQRDDNRLENLVLFESGAAHKEYEASPRGRLEEALALLPDSFSPLSRWELELHIDSLPAPAGCICGRDLAKQAVAV